MNTVLPPIPAHFTEVSSAFLRFVGPIWFAAEPNGCRLLVDVTADHIGANECVHPGFLMTLADVLGGRALALRLGQSARGSTIALQCDILESVRQGARLEGTSRIIRQTRAIAFVTCDLTSEGRRVLTASSVWKLRSGETP